MKVYPDVIVKYVACLFVAALAGVPVKAAAAVLAAVVASVPFEALAEHSIVAASLPLRDVIRKEEATIKQCTLPSNVPSPSMI